MFKLDLVKMERPLIEAHTDEGHFYKHNTTNETYISITTVFKLFSDDSWIEEFWVPSIEEKLNLTKKDARIECKRIGNSSMDVGTALHKLAELYLSKSNEFYVTPEGLEKNPHELFLVLKEWLDNNVDIVHATECKLYNDDLKIAGTVDLVVTLKTGEKCIIDFKNSRKPKYPGDIVKNHYYEQMCAYGKMWQFCTGEKIDKGIVLVVSWNEKVRAFETKLEDHESDLMNWIIQYEESKCLNNNV